MFDSHAGFAVLPPLVAIPTHRLSSPQGPWCSCYVITEDRMMLHELDRYHMRSRIRRRGEINMLSFYRLNSAEDESREGTNWLASF